jgi:hypothetical protein
MSQFETVGRCREAPGPRVGVRVAELSPAGSPPGVRPCGAAAGDEDRSAPARRVAILVGLLAVVALMGGVGIGEPGGAPAGRAAPAPVVAGPSRAPSASGGRTPAVEPAPVRPRLPLVPSRAGAGGG